MTKKSKITIEQTETCQEQPQPIQEQTEPLTAKEQYYRAGDEIKRLKTRLTENRETIQDHVTRITALQERHRDARQSYEAAQTNEQNHMSQVERQRALAKIGGAAEQAALHAMQAVQDNLAKITEEARQALGQAEKDLAETAGIVDAIEQIKPDIEQMERELEVMKDIEREMLYKWGQDEEEALSAELKEAQELLAEQEKAVRQAREVLGAKQQSIKERLRYWPGRRERLEEEHSGIIIKKEDPSKSPEEHVFEAKIAYMEALGKHGPQCKVQLHHVLTTELLALPQQAIAQLMHPRSGIWEELWENGRLVRTNHLIKSAQSHIDEARRNRS